MGAKSQRKGRAAELELSRILQGYGYDVEPGRALSYGEVPDLSGLPGVHIECKRAEALRLSEWMAQAERDAQRFGDGLPAVFFRRSRSPWCVVMKLEDWMGLYQRQKTAKAGKDVNNDSKTAKSPCGAIDSQDESGSGENRRGIIPNPAGLFGKP